MKKLLAHLIHDFVAHPLIGALALVGQPQARWAWRLHDWMGEIATEDVAGTTATIAGAPDVVRRASAVLAEHGFSVLDDHWHGPTGRGQMVISDGR